MSNPLMYAHHLYLNGEEIQDLVIPNSVTSISDYAFSGCSGLTSIIIPNSVMSIGIYAFSGCNGIKSLTISNSLSSISSHAFQMCSSLTCVAIPNGVTKIYDDAFYGCSSLAILTIPNSVTYIMDTAFDGCNNLNTIVSKMKKPCLLDAASFGIGSDVMLIVPKGSKVLYQEAKYWNSFKNIRELFLGDVNLDDKVNKEDLNVTTNFIMGKDLEGIYESLADLNDDEKVNAADVVRLVDILNMQDGLSNDWQLSFNSSQVVSSLACTLNNNTGKAIQLTKCELYYNQSLAGYATFNYTLASGGSKKCSFDDLASFAAKTGFSVVWYYTYNGDDYTYNSNLTE